MGNRPLYRVLFNFMPSFPEASLDLPGVQAELFSIGGTRHSIADLSLHVRSSSGALLCRMLYKTDLFSDRCAHNFVEQFRVLMQQVLEAPQSCLKDATYHNRTL
jgi:hypothetical protein